MRFEPTVFPGPLPEGEPVTFEVRDENSLPLLTAEEAERGTVFVQMPDGSFREAHTVVDPETGGVYAQPKD